jgi:hypothetical protein
MIESRTSSSSVSGHAIVLPFDGVRLDGLLDEAGIDALVISNSFSIP